jgi:serine kinase of HPr protein (carbohydrate metabolism regulator)
MLSLHLFLHDRLRDLGISTIVAPEGLNKTFAGIDVRICRRLSFREVIRKKPSIGIVTPGMLEKFSGMDNQLQEDCLKVLGKNRVLFLIFSQTTVLPTSLKSLCEKQGLSAAGSELNEHILSSRLKSLIQERIRFRIRFHGVAVETRGKGILITGPSGIGKTSSALKFVRKGHYWIADDLVMVWKNRYHQLMVSGHQKISQYVHTDRTGVVPVDHCIEKKRIKKRTVLWGIIELSWADDKPQPLDTGVKGILEMPVRYVRLPMGIAGYFNESLLEKAITQLHEAV